MHRKVVLHLGIHKTATTALQEFLERESRSLRDNGAVYIPLAEMREEISPLIRSNQPLHREFLIKMAERMGAASIILSDENIAGLTSDICSGVLYPYAGGRVTRLCKDFADWSVDIVLTVRSPKSYILSSYSEYLRHHDFCRFEDYIRDFDMKNFSYTSVFSWASDLPANARVTILPFEAANGGGLGHVAKRILTLACGPFHGIRTEDFPITTIRSSFSAEEIALAQKIADNAGPTAAMCFLRMIGFRDFRFGETRFDPLPADLSRSMEDRYLADLPRLAAYAENPR